MPDAQGKGSPAALRPPARSIATTGAHACADRKRQRRSLQNALVSALDRALPDRARSKAFKGAGPRSAGIRGRSIFNVLTDCIGWIKQLHLQAACTLAAKHGKQARFVEMGHHAFVSPAAVLPFGGGQAPRVATEAQGTITKTGLNIGGAPTNPLECLQRRGDQAPAPLPERHPDAPTVVQQQVSGSWVAHLHSTCDSEEGWRRSVSAVDKLGQSTGQGAPRGGTEVWSRSLSPRGTSWRWQRIWKDPRAAAMAPPRLIYPDVLEDACGAAPSAEPGGQIDQTPASAVGTGDANARFEPEVLAHFQALHDAQLLYTLRDSFGAQHPAALHQLSIPGIPSMPAGPNVPLDGHLPSILTNNAPCAAAPWAPVVITQPQMSAFSPGSKLSGKKAFLHQNCLGRSSSASLPMALDTTGLSAILTVAPHSQALRTTQLPHRPPSSSPPSSSCFR